MSEEKTKQNKPNVKPSTLFTRDNLEILRGFDDEIFDMIYLDPPFNSNRTYNVIYKDRENKRKQVEAFKDTWTMNDITAAEFGELAHSDPLIHALIRSLAGISGDAHQAYLTMMAVRLVEMRRVLKPTGSIYLHCDPTMSHSLKLVMDAVFGLQNYRNTIVWERSYQHNLAKKRLDTVSDTLLFYSKSADFKFNAQYDKVSETDMLKKFPYLEKETNRRYTHDKLEQTSNMKPGDKVRIIQGRKVVTELGWRWSQAKFDKRIKENPNLIYWTNAGRPRYKRYAEEYEGRMLNNIWTDIKGLGSNSKERVHFGTQKPLALLERIIKMSSDVGDWVLDPFCGCATTCVAAQRLNREWVGIDIAPIAVDLVKERLKKVIPLETQNVIARVDVPKRKGEIIRTPKEKLKHRLFGIQQGMCLLCLRQFDFVDMQMDHEVPRAQGGQDDDRNMQLLCAACNLQGKGKLTMAEARVKIRDWGIYKPENEPKLKEALKRLQEFRDELTKEKNRK